MSIPQCFNLWGIDKKYHEFKDLVPFKELDETKPPKKEEMIEELAKVLVEMINNEILKHNDEDAEACISSPKDVSGRVIARVKSQQALGEQLEEEFLSYVSSGIQKLLSRRSQELKSKPSRNDATVQSSESSITVVGTLNDDALPPTTPVVGTPNDNALPLTTPGSEPDSTSGEEVADKDEIYHPLMDNLESEWFEKYADHMVGQPRKMKRISNSYMGVSRIIAKKLSPKLASSEGDDFRRKLMKMIILIEQWPYRMAWLMVIVQNVQQELTLEPHPHDIDAISFSSTSNSSTEDN